MGWPKGVQCSPDMQQHLFTRWFSLMIVYGVAGLHTQYDLIGNSHGEDIIGLIQTAIET